MEKIFLINMKIPGAHLQIKTYVPRRESDRQTDGQGETNIRQSSFAADRQTDGQGEINIPPPHLHQTSFAGDILFI